MLELPLSNVTSSLESSESFSGGASEEEVHEPGSGGRLSPLARELSYEHMQFIEEIGLIFELDGLPRMAGRIFGCLLLADPPYQSGVDLADGLQASKGSISTMTRLLIKISLIERVSIPGDRRDYYQIKPNAWSHLNQQLIAKVSAVRQLAERGLRLLEGSSPGRKQRLQEMYDIHAFWEEELPRLNQRWEETRQPFQRSSTPRIGRDRVHP